MTKLACGWCGRPMAAPVGPGRPRRFCRASCKQRDYEARRRARELGLGEHELVITRSQLAEVLDRRFLLACSAEDVERDLGTGDLGVGDALAALLTAVHDFLAFEPADGGGAVT
ncbi:MAG: hypothetical protein ACKOBG_12795 [Actinomycetota bacterium]